MYAIRSYYASKLESDSPSAFPMLASVFTVGEETFRSIALIAVADMPLFIDSYNFV